MEQPISGAEWQVMRVLWAHPGSTSQFIIQALQAGFDWETKYHYWPLLAEEDHLRLQLQAILDNSCSTKNASLVASLLELGSFSQSDLQMLQQAIASRLKDAPESLVCHCLPGQCTCGHHH